MNIMDLVEAIAPGCEVKFSGIRPGEKIHEELLSEDEGRQAVEYPDMFVIQPAHPWWDTGNLDGGQTLADGFAYGSDNNPSLLTVDELRKMAGML